METFPIVKRKDTKEHGSYLTKEVILALYDELFEAQRTRQPLGDSSRSAGRPTYRCRG